MNKDPRAIGLYIHIPFCDVKCPYCDFYSLPASDESMDRYTDVICAQLARWGESLAAAADTLYFGGGTPSLLGGRRLARMIDAARRGFSLADAEITVEVNPGTHGLSETIKRLSAAGVNRLSVGLQSADETELSLLGRRHTPAQAADTLTMARRAGIENLSLDLMLALPGQTEENISHSVAFCAEAGASHISAYLLKIEENTPFAAGKEALDLPGEEAERALYLHACGALDARGFGQYEISNFSFPGKESAHNLHYWNAEPYMGLGPSAHSFINRNRFFYPRDLSAFLQNPQTMDDGEGGSIEEYAMMRLRLTEGLNEALFKERFGCAIPSEYRTRMNRPELSTLCQVDGRGIRLTLEGFLLSNLLTGLMLGYS